MLAWKVVAKREVPWGNNCAVLTVTANKQQTAQTATHTSVAQTVDPNPIYRLENLGTKFGTV